MTVPPPEMLPHLILKLLLARPGEVVTRDELRQALWPQDTFVDFEHSLNAAIKRLRDALGDDAGDPRFIETLPRRGYRFVAPVEGAPGPVLGQSWGLRPLRAWLLAAAGAVVAAALISRWAADVPHRAASQPSIRSLAVLPLRNLTGDPAREWLADGMTEALINNLAQMADLKTVISRTSVMRYRNTEKSVPQIAKELKVDALVEGSVLQVGDNVRIQVQVIGAVPDERHLWTGTFDGEFRNVLAVQKRTAAAIAQQVRLTLTPQEQMRLAGAPVVEPEARRISEGSTFANDGRSVAVRRLNPTSRRQSS